MIYMYICYVRISWAYIWWNDDRQTTDIGKPAVVYKSERRAELEAQGFRIHGSSGDQWSDLLGLPMAKRSFKLPNPMYYVEWSNTSRKATILLALLFFTCVPVVYSLWSTPNYAIERDGFEMEKGSVSLVPWYQQLCKLTRQKRYKNCNCVLLFLFFPTFVLDGVRFPLY